MFNYNIFIDYDENNAELKKYGLNEESDVFTDIWKVEFPYLFKEGDTIRIDNLINCFNEKYYVEDIIAKVKTIEFDLWIESASEESGIDINLGLEII